MTAKIQGGTVYTPPPNFTYGGEVMDFPPPETALVLHCALIL